VEINDNVNVKHTENMHKNIIIFIDDSIITKLQNEAAVSSQHFAYSQIFAISFCETTNLTTPID